MHIFASLMEATVYYPLNIFCNARYKMLTISLLFTVEDMNVWCLLVQIFKQTNMYFLL